ncbi:MAG: outer membrane beta-barrel protein [Puia sp.]|nr:outer membrane beta-barrel protein [Puia sp.]
MKKHFYLLSACVAVCMISQAQINPGAILIGGSVSFNDESTNQANGLATKSTAFSINPYFGKAIRQNLIVGFDLLYDHSHSGNNVPDLTGNDYGLGVFVRKYKYLGNRFYLFGQTRLGGTYGKTSSKSADNLGNIDEADTKSYSVSLGFMPGISYAISRKWQVEATLPNLAYIEYTHGKTTNSPSSAGTDYTQHAFTAGSILNNYPLTLGISFLLNR